jgi:hypothetical protein
MKLDFCPMSIICVGQCNKCVCVFGQGAPNGKEQGLAGPMGDGPGPWHEALELVLIKKGCR